MSDIIFYLKVEVAAGRSIEDACKEGIRLATDLSLMVEFDFNGISIYTYSHSTVKALVESYHQQLADPYLGE